MLSPDVLDWLRRDPAFIPGAAAHEALGLDFSGKQTRRSKVEEQRKITISGALGDCSSGSMNGLSVAESLPAERVCAWQQAFCTANAVAIADADGLAKAMVKPMKDHGNNGEHFLQTSWQQWFLTCGELSFVQPRNLDDTYWEEPLHPDGGGSVLHMGLTLYGRRLSEACEEDGTRHGLENEPGTVYFGLLTGPKHQVRHLPAVDGELLDVPGLGALSATVMMRTALFPMTGRVYETRRPVLCPWFAR